MTTKQLAMILLQYPSGTEIILNDDDGGRKYISNIGKLKINECSHHDVKIEINSYIEDELHVRTEILAKNKYMEDYTEY